MIDEPIYPYFIPLREDDEKVVAEVIYNKKGDKGILYVYKSKYDNLPVNNGKEMVLDTEFINSIYSMDKKTHE